VLFTYGGQEHLSADVLASFARNCAPNPHRLPPVPIYSLEQDSPTMPHVPLPCDTPKALQTIKRACRALGGSVVAWKSAMRLSMARVPGFEAAKAKLQTKMLSGEVDASGNVMDNRWRKSGGPGNWYENVLIGKSIQPSKS
jgi:hypothetical protein